MEAEQMNNSVDHLPSFDSWTGLVKSMQRSRPNCLQAQHETLQPHTEELELLLAGCTLAGGQQQHPDDWLGNDILQAEATGLDSDMNVQSFSTSSSDDSGVTGDTISASEFTQSCVDTRAGVRHVDRPAATQNSAMDVGRQPRNTRLSMPSAAAGSTLPGPAFISYYYQSATGSPFAGKETHMQHGTFVPGELTDADSQVARVVAWQAQQLHLKNQQLASLRCQNKQLSQQLLEARVAHSDLQDAIRALQAQLQHLAIAAASFRKGAQNNTAGAGSYSNPAVPDQVQHAVQYGAHCQQRPQPPFRPTAAVLGTQPTQQQQQQRILPWLSAVFQQQQHWASPSKTQSISVSTSGNGTASTCSSVRHSPYPSVCGYSPPGQGAGNSSSGTAGPTCLVPFAAAHTVVLSAENSNSSLQHASTPVTADVIRLGPGSCSSSGSVWQTPSSTPSSPATVGDAAAVGSSAAAAAALTGNGSSNSAMLTPTPPLGEPAPAGHANTRLRLRRGICKRSSSCSCLPNIGNDTTCTQSLSGPDRRSSMACKRATLQGQEQVDYDLTIMNDAPVIGHYGVAWCCSQSQAPSPPGTGVPDVSIALQAISSIYMRELAQF